MSQVAKTKPVKLRAACNQCNATKTRCSGEKTGCSRCQSLCVECVYAESRVGRVPGVRAKRKPETTETAASREPPNTTQAVTPSRTMTQGVNETIELEFPATRIQNMQTRSPEPEGLETFDESLFDWSEGWNEAQAPSLDSNYNFENGNSDEIFGVLQQDPQTDASQHQNRQSPQQQLSPISQRQSKTTSLSSFTYASKGYSTPGPEINHLEGSSPVLSHGHPSLQRSSTITQPTRAMENSICSQCVIACSQIILSLEKYQVDELKVLDFILGIVKKVTEKLEPLINGQVCCRNTKCLALFNVIIYQLVEMLEVGCGSFTNLEQRTPSDFLGGNFHDLEFGGLGPSYRGQNRFRSQIILEELQPVLDLVRKVLFISNSGSAKAASRPEVEIRLKTLLERVKRQGGL